MSVHKAQVKLLDDWRRKLHADRFHKGWFYNPFGCPYCTYWLVVAVGLSAMLLLVGLACGAKGLGWL
jgi:hypothetical protein